MTLNVPKYQRDIPTGKAKQTPKDVPSKPAPKPKEKTTQAQKEIPSIPKPKANGTGSRLDVTQ